MIKGKVLQMEVPLFSLLQHGTNNALETKRLRPEDALDFNLLAEELKKQTLVKLFADNGEWSLVAAKSPYTTDMQVMLIETSLNRYLPGPEYLPTPEGEKLLEVWACVLDFISSRGTAASLQAGYNWSPRSWGLEEEKTGFQSIPTKWHAMLWGWPPLPSLETRLPSARWVERAEVDSRTRALLGENDYVLPLGELMRHKLEKVAADGVQNDIFTSGEWQLDRRGISLPLKGDLQDIFRSKTFFGSVIKPAALILEELFRDLSEAVTDMSCAEIDSILVKTAEKSLSMEEISTLRRAPLPREEKEARALFAEKGFPLSLWECLRPYLHNDNKEKAPGWRKGFGYALVCSASAVNGAGEMRIMPGVCLGPGGVVEALGVALKRPENKLFSPELSNKRSKELWELAEHIREQFPELV